MATAVPFRDELPPGYEWFDDEVDFEPRRHLALERPSQVTTLADLGYDPASVSELPTQVAASGPFRILSDEGADVMLSVARRLRTEARSCERIQNMTRGGVFQSRWLRDLCLDPSLAELMSEVYGTDVGPHPMPSHLGHLNYEPDEVDVAVDKWHHDTLPLDFVMAVTDLSTTNGGAFQYFLGTKDEAAALGEAGRTPPPDRVVSAACQPGVAVALHGNMVVHRGAPLAEPAERITMVNGYVALDTSVPDQSRTIDLIEIDDPAFLYTDWARHVAWRGAGRLQAVVDALPYGVDDAEAVARLREAIVDVEAAIADIERGGPDRIHHYEHTPDSQT